MTDQEIKDLLDFNDYCPNEEMDIETYDDIYSMDDKFISLERVEKLKTLLFPLTKVNGKLNLEMPALKAAFFLTGWGYDEGVEYLQAILEYSHDELDGDYYPHRLHLYDTIYELIKRRLSNYHIRYSDYYYHEKTQKNHEAKKNAYEKVLPSFINIINRAKEEFVSLSIYRYTMSDAPYRDTLYEALNDTLNYLKEKSDKTFLDERNIEDITIALEKANI